MLGLIQFLPLVVVIIVAISVVRNVLRLTKKLGDGSSPLSRTPPADDPDLTDEAKA